MPLSRRQRTALLLLRRRKKLTAADAHKGTLESLRTRRLVAGHNGLYILTPYGHEIAAKLAVPPKTKPPPSPPRPPRMRKRERRRRERWRQRALRSFNELAERIAELEFDPYANWKHRVAGHGGTVGDARVESWSATVVCEDGVLRIAGGTFNLYGHDENVLRAPAELVSLNKRARLGCLARIFWSLDVGFGALTVFDAETVRISWDDRLPDP